MNRGALLTALTLSAFCLPAPESAEAREEPAPFAQGRFRISAGGGTTFGGGGGVVLTAGFGYFIADGLEAGLDGDVWLGGEALMGSVAPQVRYLLPHLFPVVPYAGVFYRHTFIEDPWEDQDHLGSRAGVLISLEGRFLLGGGLVTEYTLSGCSGECLDYYPEIAFSVTF